MSGRDSRSLVSRVGKNRCETANAEQRFIDLLLDINDTKIKWVIPKRTDRSEEWNRDKTGEGRKKKKGGEGESMNKNQ